jgi:HAD superfamily hydrolase (TIGR01509 family)
VIPRRERYAALLFDVDGTLAETEELHRRAFNDSFAYFGLPWVWDFALYRELLRVTGGQERIRHFLRTFATSGDDLSDAEVAELHRFKTARYASLVATGACELRPGVADVIRRASGSRQRLAIVTTTTRANVDALLDVTLGKAGTGYFEAIVCGDDVERKKPAPDAYNAALDRLGLPATSCLAIEDSRNGLVAATAAGVAVLITRSAYFSDENFDGALQVVGDLTELQAFVLA